MGRASAEHWKGIAAGIATWLLIYAACCAYLLLWFPTESLLGTIGSCYGVEVAPARSVPVVLVRSESEPTPVIENPYGLGTCYRPPRWSNPVLGLLALLLSGAVAALVGPRVVAWRGCVPGVFGGTVLAVCGEIVGPFIFKPLEFAGFLVIASLLCGLLGYAGGGFAKFLTRARARRA